MRPSVVAGHDHAVRCGQLRRRDPFVGASRLRQPPVHPLFPGQFRRGDHGASLKVIFSSGGTRSVRYRVMRAPATTFVITRWRFQSDDPVNLVGRVRRWQGALPEPCISPSELGSLPSLVSRRDGMQVHAENGYRTWRTAPCAKYPALGTGVRARDGYASRFAQARRPLASITHGVAASAQVHRSTDRTVFVPVPSAMAPPPSAVGRPVPGP